jgi:hypothetical protein
MSAVLGSSLSCEEFSGLEVATLQRKLQENLNGSICFWGKIYGTTQDYLIVYNIDPFSEFPDKKYYFWYACFVLIHFFACSALSFPNSVHDHERMTNR